MKAKPMTAGEFARYAESVPKDQFDKFNAMLSFVEDVVTERCATVAESFNAEEAYWIGDLTLKQAIAKKIRAGLNA